MNEMVAVIKAQIGKSRQTESFVFGEVTKLSPLEIAVDDSPPILEEIIIVGINCRERRAYFDKHSHEILELSTEPTSSYTVHAHDVPDHATEETENYIIVNRGLRVGDKVLMLAATDGQKYYLLERIGEDRG